MCRRNLIPAVGLMGVGAGLLASCCIDSCIVTFCLAMASIGGGFCVMRRR